MSDHNNPGLDQYHSRNSRKLHQGQSYNKMAFENFQKWRSDCDSVAPLALISLVGAGLNIDL